MKTGSTAFLALAIMITLLTNRCSTKNSLLWQEVLVMFLSVPQLLKPLANIFSHRYIYLVTCRLHCTWTPYYKIKTEKQYHEIKLRSFSKKRALASEYYYTCLIVLLFIFLHRFIRWKLSPDRV